MVYQQSGCASGGSCIGLSPRNRDEVIISSHFSSPPPRMTLSLRSRAKAIVDAHATSVRGLHAHQIGLRDYLPSASDVFIVSGMKSGTTLMQQMVYQLLVITGHVRSDPTGEAFDDISQVIPHVDIRHSTGLHASIHDYTPRVWKSHCVPAMLPFGPEVGVRFIYCFREGREVIRSYTDFAVDWLAETPVHGEGLRREVYWEIFLRCFLGLQEVEGEEDVFRRVEPLHDWFGNVKAWLEAPYKVLYVHYDDLIKDVSGWVRRVARFIGVEGVGEREVEYVVQRCDRGRMAADGRFRDLLVSQLMGWRKEMGFRVRKEGEKGFKEVRLPEECEREYAKRFNEMFGVGDWETVVRRAERRNEEAGI